MCKFISEQNLDILCLQEASTARLKKLVLYLSENRNETYTIASKFGGTAIVTRLVTEALDKPGNGRYCCSQVWIPGMDRPCRVICLHLDHRNEVVRLKEIHTIVQDMNANGYPKFDFWMGDFNALTESDYTKNEWNDIATVRAENHWEHPVSNLTDFMTLHRTKKSARLGLRDAFAAALERHGTVGTSRFHTRVDYVLYNGDYFQDDSWIVTSCIHADCTKLSDHNLVMVTFDHTGTT